VRISRYRRRKDAWGNRARSFSGTLHVVASWSHSASSAAREVFLTTRRLEKHPKHDVVSSSTVSTTDGEETGGGVGAGVDGVTSASAALDSARSLARALAAQRSSGRATRGCSSVVVAVVSVGVIGGDGMSWRRASSRVVVVIVDVGVSGKFNARGVGGARSSAEGATNSKLSSPSFAPSFASSRTISSIALNSFGINRSLIVARSAFAVVGVVVFFAPFVSPPDFFTDAGAASPRLRTDACALTLCARTRAPYASYASNASVPFFATYE